MSGIVKERIALLKKFYSPVGYRGTVFFRDSPNIITFDSYKERRLAEEENRPVKNFFIFKLEYRLEEHVEGGNNLGIVFPSDSSIIAFDLDCKDTSLRNELEHTLVILNETLKAMRITPFVYLSGGKGYHVDIKTSNPINTNKLKLFAKVIIAKAIERGANKQFFDCVYPSKKSYRVFGCKHYKTGVFTRAILIRNGTILELSEKDSWGHFYSMNHTYSYLDEHVMDKIIKNYPHLSENPLKKPCQSQQGTTPIKTHQVWDVPTLKRIYEKGLFDNYTRYHSAFNLGRYFKHILKITEEEAKLEIDTWLKRHSLSICNTTHLDYFGEEAENLIKTPYESCVQETTDNCINGYHKGRPFRKVAIIIEQQKSELHIDSLAISDKKKEALKYLLGLTIKFKSLYFFHGYEQLLSGWNVGSRYTVSNWLKEFYEIGILIRIKKGSSIAKLQSKYKLNLPPDCYEEVEAN